MSGKLLRSILIDSIVGGLLLTLMPSLRQWQLTPTTQNDTASDSPVSYNAAVRHAAPAVVNVYNRTLNSTSHNQLTLGSGVTMDQHGYILTDKHVINGTDQIIVALQDGRAFKALLVGSGTLADFTVLRINTADGLLAIPVNPKRMSHIDDVVPAIGNPYSLGQTIAQGVISATGCIDLNPTGHQNFLQTDTSIDHGNSGEALMSSLGELMGINTLSFDKSGDNETPEGIDFAIPLQSATRITDRLIRDGRVIHGCIDIGGWEVALLHAQGDGIDRIQGVVVSDVTPDDPAAQAGIHANDVIISVNDKLAVSTLETMDQVAEIRPGSGIPVVVMRNDKKITLHITVQEYPVTN